MPAGGKRKGAGRKPASAEKKIKAFRLAADVIKIIEKQPNQTAFIEKIIRESI